MAPKPRSSFIPKQTPTTATISVKSKRRLNILNLLTSGVFVLAIAASGGVYFYKENVVQERLNEEKKLLASEKDKFDKDGIAEVREFDRRLKAARLLLSQHISPSKVLDSFEVSTMQNVQFTEFAFEQRPSSGITISARGGTEEFSTLLLQDEEFGDDPLLRVVDFEDVALNDALGLEEPVVVSDEEEEAHRVTFSILGDLPASQLLFEGSAVETVIEEQGASRDLQQVSDEDLAEETIVDTNN